MSITVTAQRSGIGVIFLDVDGVLNSAEYHRERHVRGRKPLDPVAVRRLNHLTDRTGARIVISSSWRQWGFLNVRQMLKDAGVTGWIVSRTPILDSGRTETGIYGWVPRGVEIASWLASTRTPVDRFVILDDEDDMAHVGHRLVRTSHDVGLTDEDVARAHFLLTGKRL